MEKVVLITPGHSPPFDTLIALGLSTSVLNVDPEARLKINKIGNRYRLEVETTADWLECSHYASSLLKFEAKYAELTNSGKLQYTLLPQPAIKPGTLKVLAKLLEESEMSPKDYLNPNHMSLLKEGRVGKKGKKDRYRRKVVYVQVAPWAGKFLAESYSSSVTEYVACPLCICFAWVGLLSSVAVIAVREEKGIRVLYAAPDPIRSDEIDIALLTTIFGEKCEIIPVRRDGWGSPPIVATPLLVLATGETMYPLKGDFGVIVWEHSRAGFFIGIKSQIHMPLKPLLDFIARAKSEGRYLAALVAVSYTHLTLPTN